jgi:high-affinity iron transporter
MLKVTIVIFRECLEIAVVLGIILAATRNVQGRSAYIIAGVMGGTFCAALLAFFTQQLAASFGGIGDELFNAAVILFTVIVIGWTAVWMQGYTRYIKQSVDTVATQITQDNIHKAVLSLLVAGTIFREVSEIILFVYSLVISSSMNSVDYLMGFVIGTTCGIVVGISTYRGLLKFSGKYVFKTCSYLLIFIAAGLAAEAAGILTSVGVITHLTYIVWDSSWLVLDQSTVGKVLKIFIGYNAKPNMMQLIFYCTTLIALFVPSILQSKKLKTRV